MLRCGRGSARDRDYRDDEHSLASADDDAHSRASLGRRASAGRRTNSADDDSDTDSEGSEERCWPAPRSIVDGVCYYVSPHTHIYCDTASIFRNCMFAS